MAYRDTIDPAHLLKQIKMKKKKKQDILEFLESSGAMRSILNAGALEI